MRAALPGTKHSTSLDRRERAILEAVQSAPSVRKMETSRLRWTGPSLPRLRLRPTIFAGTVESGVQGWLYLGSAKRLLLISPVRGVSLEALAQELALILVRYGIDVEIVGGETKKEEERMQIAEWIVLNPQKSWVSAELVHAGVVQVKALEEQEFELQVRLEEISKQLEDIRRQRQEIQMKTLETVAQMLMAC